MKSTILIFILFLCYNNCYGSLFGITDSIFKKETKNITTELSAIKNATLNINTDITGLKSQIGELNLKVGQINNELSAKIVGIDKSVNSEIKAGRDAISGSGNTNDTKLMIFIIKGLCGLCTLLIGIVSLTVKSMFKKMDNARFYQNSVAKMIKNVEFDDMMKQKREMEKQKSILSKSLAFIKQGKEFMSKKEVGV